MLGDWSDRPMNRCWMTRDRLLARQKDRWIVVCWVGWLVRQTDRLVCKTDEGMVVYMVGWLDK